MYQKRRETDKRYKQAATQQCDDMRKIGAVLRTRRKELGYSQSELAQFCGFSQRLISEMERGRDTVAINKVMRYANALGIDLVLSIRGGI